MPHNPLLRFAACVLVIYALLLMLWPAVARPYAASLRAVGNVSFHSVGRDAVVRFESSTDQPPRLDTTIHFRIKSSGAKARLPVSSRFLGYVPTVLAITLVLATPLPWKRRAWALLWAVLASHLLIFIKLGMLILNLLAGSGPIAVFHPPDGLQAALSFSTDVLCISLTGCYLPPIFIWALATLRRKEWVVLTGAAHREVGK